MTEEIKGRIEQIKAGQVPEGYIKQYKYIFPVSWKLYHLGELTQNNSRKNMTADELPTYSINNQVGFIPQNEQFDEGSYSDLDKTCYKIVKRGEFAYNPARINVGSLGLLKDKDAVIVSSLYVCFSLKREFSNLYFENWFTTTAFHKEILRNLEGSVREYLFYENFSNIRLPVPPLPEQKKIAEILRQCDKVIELKQSKIEELQKLKKTCLSKMFPKEGHNVPELRFPGFTDAWEQRKVASILKVTRGYVLAATQTDKTQTEEKPYPVYSSQTKDNGLMGYHSDYLYEDAITWTTDGANAGTVRYRAGKFYCTNVCGVLLADLVTPNQMIAEALNNVAKHYVSYVGNPKLMNNVMSDIEIMIPVQGEERDKISALFAYLDDLITLHQRELEETRKYKKALMQLLLTGIVRVQR